MDNFVWGSVAPKDPANVDEVSDYLYHLCSVLLHASVCMGVTKHGDVWKKAQEMGSGTIDVAVYQNYSCFRSSDCSLILIESPKCEACKKQQKIMKDQIRRRKMGKSQDQTNNRYLDKYQIGLKATKLQKEKRLLEKQLEKLKKKINKEIEKNSIGISNDLSQDLCNIFERHNINLSKVEKLFWAQQIKALAAREKDRCSVRWNPFIIRLALHVQMRAGSSGNDYLRSFLKLPSQRLLYDYTHYVDAKERIQEATLQKMSVKTEEFKEGHEKYFSIAFDEVYVRGGIVINKKSGEMVGYSHLSEVEEEMKKLEADMSGHEFAKQPAKTVLMFLAQGITNDLQPSVVAIYFTLNLTAGQLFSRVWNVIYHMESHRLKVLTLIWDGAATNKKCFKMHPPLPPGEIKIEGLDIKTDVTYGTWNLASHDRNPLFFIVDPPHLLKTLRNCLANSHSHKKSRKMWKNGEDLSWEILENLYESTMLDKFRRNKLTRQHVKLTAFSCMNVGLAAQTMSRSSVDDITDLYENGAAFQGKDICELRKYIGHVNDSFDCYNSSGDSRGKRNKVNKLLLPHTDIHDSRFSYLSNEMLGYFKDWEKSVKNRKGKFSKVTKEQMFISPQSYESLKITTYGFIGIIQFLLRKGAETVDGRKLTQDKLEQKFGILRMSGGGNRSLGVHQLMQKVVSMEAQGTLAFPSKRGNTQVLDETWQPEETPLPRLRK